MGGPKKRVILDLDEQKRSWVNDLGWIWEKVAQVSVNLGTSCPNVCFGVTCPKKKALFG